MIKKYYISRLAFLLLAGPFLTSCDSENGVAIRSSIVLSERFNVCTQLVGKFDVRNRKSDDFDGGEIVIDENKISFYVGFHPNNSDTLAVQKLAPSGGDQNVSLLIRKDGYRSIRTPALKYKDRELIVEFTTQERGEEIIDKLSQIASAVEYCK